MIIFGKSCKSAGMTQRSGQLSRRSRRCYKVLHYVIYTVAFKLHPSIECSCRVVCVSRMHPFASYVLQSYYRATGWNEDNLYANLTRSSSGMFPICVALCSKTLETAILDFNIPRGLHLSISKSPNPLFSTSYSMNAMPSLNGSVGYIFTSCDLDIKSSGNVRFKDMVERFKLYSQPRRPEGKEEWLAGQRVDSRGVCRLTPFAPDILKR